MSDDADTSALATDLTVAWLANPHTRASGEDVSTFLSSVHSALGKLSAAAPEDAPEPTPLEYTPAVSVRKSLASPDRIVSMIDGKAYRSLTRHLSARGLTPDQYRKRYGLKPDYPMVAPAYSEARRDAAKQHRFGRPLAPTSGDTSPEPEVAAPKKTRAPKATATPPEPASTETKSRKRLGIAGAKAAAKKHLGSVTDA